MRPNSTTAYSPARRVAAWGVHLYTALGLPLVFFATIALMNGHIARFFTLVALAVIVDASDGMLARAVQVDQVLPHFLGRKLDDLIDFLSFAFLPSLALYVLGLLPTGFGALAVVPLMASGYGFCQDNAKTHDTFVGFPSYWNIVVLYLVVLALSPWVNLVVVLALSVLVFVPWHYIYPTKNQLLRPWTLGLGSLWGVAMLALCVHPKASWAPTLGWLSLSYVVYYLVLSAINHRRLRARGG